MLLLTSMMTHVLWWQEEEVEFRKTDCYHYFHTLCLLRYIDYHRRLLADEEREEMGRRKGKRERVLECPVCRNTIPNSNTTEIFTAVYIYF